MKLAKDLIAELAHLRDQIENLKQAIVERIIPSFASVTDEAQAVFETTLEQLGRESSIKKQAEYEVVRQRVARERSIPIEQLNMRQLSDEEEAGLAAQEHLYLTRTSQQAILDGMAVVLFHLFETSMLTIGRKYVAADRGSGETLSMDRVTDGLAQMNIGCRQFASWRSIRELRLVANSVKHGTVDKKLRQWRPDLFPKHYSGEVLDKMIEMFGAEAVKVLDIPLERRKLVVSQDALSSFFDSLKAFYDELGKELTKHATEH